jgi:16S rRNA (cytosine1402-N4)-methyltransferase
LIIEVINEYDENKLVEVFSHYGEVRNSKSLAAKIVRDRGAGKIEKISEFLSLIDSLIIGKRNRYLAQVFQAIRIEVNDEMGALEEMLAASVRVLDKGGKLVVMSYHSLEDRMVKRYMKAGNASGESVKDFYGNITRPFEILTKKAIEPTQKELELNTRSRSAKLRVAERI